MYPPKSTIPSALHRHPPTQIWWPLCQVLIAACDTFRSGAVEQLRVHGRCLDVPIFEKGLAFGSWLLPSATPRFSREELRLEKGEGRIDASTLVTTGNNATIYIYIYRERILHMSVFRRSSGVDRGTQRARYPCLMCRCWSFPMSWLRRCTFQTGEPFCAWGFCFFSAAAALILRGGRRCHMSAQGCAQGRSRLQRLFFGKRRRCCFSQSPSPENVLVRRLIRCVGREPH